MRTEYKNISYPQIVNGILLAYLNARRLYLDSELLFLNNKFESACFLVSISLEELGKIIILIKSFNNGPQNGIYKINFSELQGPDSHRIKLQKILHQNFFINNPVQNNIVKEEYENFKKTVGILANLINRIKKASLYTSFSQGQFTFPIVDQADLSEIVKATSNLITIYGNHCSDPETIKSWLQ